jgi:hypothetical protein
MLVEIKAIFSAILRLNSALYIVRLASLSVLAQSTRVLIIKVKWHVIVLWVEVRFSH